jgi:hypothetical protein
VMLGLVAGQKVAAASMMRTVALVGTAGARVRQNAHLKKTDASGLLRVQGAHGCRFRW